MCDSANHSRIIRRDEGISARERSRDECGFPGRSPCFGPDESGVDFVLEEVPHIIGCPLTANSEKGKASASFIADGRFHDLRSTALTNWFAMGFKEYEVMRLAGHSKFETTHRFYLAVVSRWIRRRSLRGEMAQTVRSAVCLGEVGRLPLCSQGRGHTA
jgi:integrase